MAAPSTFLCLALAVPALSLTPPEGSAILAGMDRYSHPWPSFSVDVTVREGGKEQRWRVTARENGDAVVVGVSPKEEGRRVLCLGDRMWLTVPGSKRPLKVSPQQRMMGPAAGGDLARTRFADAYTVASVEASVREGVECNVLRLEAKRPSETHRVISLWAAGATAAPLYAECYLASGKLARTVTFGPIAKAQGVWALTGMTIRDMRGGVVDLLFESWRRTYVNPADFEAPGGSAD